jgi:hypothetical protein
LPGISAGGAQHDVQTRPFRPPRRGIEVSFQIMSASSAAELAFESTSVGTKSGSARSTAFTANPYVTEELVVVADNLGSARSRMPRCISIVTPSRSTIRLPTDALIPGFWPLRPERTQAELTVSETAMYNAA